MQQKKDGMFFNAFEGLESVDPNAPPRRGHHRDKKKAKPLSDVERQQSFLEGLVIVGYESNLFRNDRLSESIERGEHFIPWMGKEDLMIDRYDARALLTDLKLFDRQAGRWDALPRTRKPSDPKYERELKLNKKLDKERYWDMVLHGEDIYKGIIVSPHFTPCERLPTLTKPDASHMPLCTLQHSYIITLLPRKDEE
jgi:hypothetical protein